MYFILHKSIFKQQSLGLFLRIDSANIHSTSYLTHSYRY